MQKRDWCFSTMIDFDSFVFSASSIKDYLQCGLKFKYSRLDKLERAETFSHHRWFGTLVHSAIYTAIASSATGKDMPLREEIKETFPSKVFEALWQEKDTQDETILSIRKGLGSKPVGRFTEGKIKALKKGLNQTQLEKGWKAEAKKMVKNGILVAKGIYKIVELERKFQWEMFDNDFVGYADIIALDENGRYCFYDFKTTWDRPGKKLIDDFQFFAYAVAMKDLYNLDYYPTGYYVHLRSGDCIEYELTEEINAKMTKKTLNAFSDMKDNLFLADLGGPLCKFCDFRLKCYGSEDKIWSRGW